MDRLEGAEFFAGIGLVRRALTSAEIRVTWANDVDPIKHEIYAANFDAKDFHLGDVRNVKGIDVPHVALATASFPCTDLSLAGNRAGLVGAQSGMFWEFTRIVEEMGERKPRAILLENVPGFATSHGGADLENAVRRLNDLGYWCDIFVMNARLFVPQSRPRLFIVGLQHELEGSVLGVASDLRPQWISKFATAHDDLNLHAFDLPIPPQSKHSLAEVVDEGASDWWDQKRLAAFLSSLSEVQQKRLAELKARDGVTYRTAYRRTRDGKPVWEIRADDIAGCLRTARGGSSKQALVEVKGSSVRVRWMTPLEYGRLQGSGAFRFGKATPAQALYGFGDAVCVPVIAWIAKHYLAPALRGRLAFKQLEQASA